MSWLKYRPRTGQGPKPWEYVEIPSQKERRRVWGCKTLSEWVDDFAKRKVYPRWTHVDWVTMDYFVVPRIPEEVIREKRKQANRLAANYKLEAERYMEMLQKWYL